MVKVRIGLVVPASNFIPYLPADLQSAFESGLAHAGLDAEVVPEPGYSSDPKELPGVLQRLAIKERASVIVTPLGAGNFSAAATLADSFGTKVVVLSMGEDPWPVDASARLAINSFHLWHSVWVLGYEGVRRFGPKAAYCASFHEAGYGLGFAFGLGVEAAGGTVTHVTASHKESRSEDPSPQIHAMADSGSSFVMALQSSKEAISFLNAYQASGVRETLPCLGLFPLAEPHVRSSAASALEGIRVVEALPVDYAAPILETGRPASAYSLLAYEAAHLLSNSDSAWIGPRGPVRFTARPENIPFRLRTISAAGDRIESLEAPPLLYEQFPLACERLPKQGWLNPYLCA